MRTSIVIRRMFLAGVGLVYAVAFVSLWVQIHGLIGSQGLLPAGEYLAAIGPQLGAQRWWRAPTLAWLTGAGDSALHLLCGAGTVSSLLLMAGVAPVLTALASWALYLSLYTCSRDFLAFQWDILLLEAGFLAFFYAPLAWGPRARGWQTPPPVAITWLLRALVAKLMFLSGVVKLSGGDPTWRNLTALAWHYETTCLPTWTGWYVHQLPLWFHQGSALGMFAVELGLPLLALGPRRLRLVAAAGFAALMAFIAATGNYGFFNLLAVVLCIPLLDDTALPRSWRIQTGMTDTCSSPTSASASGGGQEGARLAGHPRSAIADPTPPPRWPRAVSLAVALLVLALTPVPVARAFRTPIAWPWPIAWLFERQAPFHLVNGYGLFARMTTQRPEIIVEGSRDGETWEAYEFRWKPGDPRRRPGFVQPHMPRLDWQMWFAALGSYQQHRWFVVLCRRLLEGAPPVLALLERNPFPDAPPRFVRARVYDYRFASAAERRDTGAWWRRQEMRPYLPVLYLAADGLRAR